jgi:hypothetical protein
MMNRQAAGKVLRGGSFNNNQNNAAASYRNNNNPNNDNNNYGVRLVVAAHTLLTLQRTAKAVCSQKCRATTVFRLRRRRKDSAGGSGLHAAWAVMGALPASGIYKRLGVAWIRSRHARPYS